MKAFCAAVNGMGVTIVTVEVGITRGVLLHLTGLADGAIKESHDRIAAVLLNTGYKSPVTDITTNLAPADFKKIDSSFDLPSAIAILSANEKVGCDRLQGLMLVGESSLDGTLQLVKGTLPIAVKARAEEFKGIIVPKANEHEAAVIDTLEVYGTDSILQVIDSLSGTSNPEPYFMDTRKEFYEHQYAFDLDFADVRGRENVKQALEAIAAGGHNLIMVEPPGSGKSMVAKRPPSILPPLSLSESLETTQIHPITDKLRRDTRLIMQRPFHSPHYTTSEVTLAGDGADPMPGKITLAHNGVLFCDELPESSKHTLEVLRQSLEGRYIAISRTEYTATYPCSFMFIVGMNPCSCGYFADLIHRRVCILGQIQECLAKISGPLMGRIDIQREAAPLSFRNISQATPGKPSVTIRERVIRARAIQTDRLSSYRNIHCSAQMSKHMIHEFAEPDEASIKLLRDAMERLKLSTHAYSRILRVMRLIADLEESGTVQVQHIAEAIGYRNLGRSDRAER